MISDSVTVDNILIIFQEQRNKKHATKKSLFGSDWDIFSSKCANICWVCMCVRVCVCDKSIIGFVIMRLKSGFSVCVYDTRMQYKSEDSKNSSNILWFLPILWLIISYGFSLNTFLWRSRIWRISWTRTIFWPHWTSMHGWMMNEHIKLDTMKYPSRP